MSRLFTVSLRKGPKENKTGAGREVTVNLPTPGHNPLLFIVFKEEMKSVLLVWMVFISPVIKRRARDGDAQPHFYILNG